MRFFSRMAARVAQAHHTHHSCDHCVRLRADSGLQQGLRASQNLGVHVGQAYRQVTGRRLIGEDRQPGPEFSDLRLQPLHIHVGGKGGHTQSQLLRHVQCLAADRTGGT